MNLRFSSSLLTLSSILLLLILLVGKEVKTNDCVLNQLLLEDIEPVMGIPCGEESSTHSPPKNGDSREQKISGKNKNIDITKERKGNRLIFRKKIKLHRTCHFHTIPIYPATSTKTVYVTCLQSVISTTILHTSTTFTSLHRYTKTVNVPVEGDPVTKTACNWKYTTVTSIIPTCTTEIKVVQTSVPFCSTPQITTYLIETQLIDDCVTM